MVGGEKYLIYESKSNGASLFRSLIVSKNESVLLGLRRCATRNVQMKIERQAKKFMY